MRVAIIDLGTNSVRFDVHHIAVDGKTRPLHREKLMVRLGQGVFLNGKLDPEASRRTLHAFRSFAVVLKDLSVQRVTAFGTSALREASDGDRLLAQIQAQTGIAVRVISGAEEARLIALGVLKHESGLKGSKRFGLLDIGGGSTEFTLCRGKKVLHSDSFALGTARLQQVFLRSSPPSPLDDGEDPVVALRRSIKSAILPKILGEEWGKVPLVLGSSGTIRTVARILRGEKDKTKPCDRADLKKLIRSMSSMTTTELLGIRGMEAKRVDMILAGAILLDECLEAVGAKKFRVTEYSLRDGILEEEIRIRKEQTPSSLPFHLEDLRKKAKKLGANVPHLLHVTRLSELLFDRLRKLHRLDNSWRTYLSAAAILHDVGETVSPTHHEKHSYYLVKHADIPSMDRWESEFVAELCRWHRSGDPDLKTLSFNGGKERKAAWIKLLPLLRLADALDRGHKGQAEISQVKLERGKVKLTITGKTVDLELLRAEQKKELFEEVYQRELEMVRG